jgi:hypothetical protein
MPSPLLLLLLIKIALSTPPAAAAPAPPYPLPLSPNPYSGSLPPASLSTLFILATRSASRVLEGSCILSTTALLEQVIRASCILMWEVDCYDHVETCP